MRAARCLAGAALVALVGLVAPGCGLRPEPALEATRFAPPTRPIQRVSVTPFVASSRLVRGLEGSEAEAREAAVLVGRFVAEALQARGVAVIPPSDLARLFASEGRPVPVLDAYAAAEIASQEFGADAVLLGQVDRFREREGEALGAERPASVSFQVTLHGAPSATRIWTARFDETQKPLSDNIFNLPRYPGGGTRWLTAAELARWGAKSVAQELPLGP